MAAFTPKTSEQILRDAIDYLYHNTNLSDFNVGSVIRTILEVMAIEDAEQYFQMFSILESFFLRSASGAALDERAKEYNMVRLTASASTGEVVFINTNLKRSYLIQDVVAGDAVIFVQDATVFPADPFYIQLGEGGQLERVNITGVDAASGSLTIDPATPLLYSHSAASTGIDEVDNLSSLVTLWDSVQPAKIIPTGITLRAEPTNVTFSVECLTMEVGLHPTGYFLSNPVKVKSSNIGVQTNVPPRRLNEISGGAPYSGASVVNMAAISGGRSAETDPEFRDRIRQSISKLAKGTPAALASAIIGTSTSSQTISRARIVEDFTHTIVDNPGYATVYAYVDDASVNFKPDEETTISSTLSIAAGGGATKLVLNSPGFPVATVSNKVYIIIDPNGAAPFITTYSAADGVNLLGLSPSTVGVTPAGTTISECEAISLSTEDGQKYYQTNKFPIGDDGLTLFLIPPLASLGAATKLTQLMPGFPKTYVPGSGVIVEDFILNEAVGQIEFFDAKIPLEGSQLFAIYENYTGLIKEAQLVVDGNLSDLTTYPGVRSAGVKVLVRPAKRSSVDVTVELSVDTALTNIANASFLVRQALISYINNLDIGEDVIVSEMIERSMGILGVTNCKIINPADDFAINHDSVAYADDITVL